jgi:hypothetical protein
MTASPFHAAAVEDLESNPTFLRGKRSIGRHFIGILMTDDD